jgi:hypothetical protein
MCYLDTLRDSDRPTWWAYYIHTFIYVYLYIYLSRFWIVKHRTTIIQHYTYYT